MQTIPVSLGWRNTLGANDSRLTGREEYTRWRTIPVSLGGRNTLGANDSRLTGREEYTRCKQFPPRWDGGIH